MKSISIIIPTYNRLDQLSCVIEHLLKSDVSVFSEVQIIIVDDGSPISSRTIVENKIVSPPFSIQYLCQENAGPSVARNNGLKHAIHEIVLFIDDDILAEPDLLVKHLRGHNENANSVVYGYCPYVIPVKETPAYRFLKKLIDLDWSGSGKQDRYILMNSIASGNISIEKSMFPDGEFYKSSLRTPAAEEFELMARLLDKGIKFYFNPTIVGWHLQPATIEDKCKQELKYGTGIAEVSLKMPYTLKYGNLSKMFYANCIISPKGGISTSFKKIIKGLFSKQWSRSILLKIVKAFERILPINFILFPLYRFLLGCFLFAGVNEGIKKFSSTKKIK